MRLIAGNLVSRPTARIAISIATILCGCHTASAFEAVVPRFREHISETWKHEQFEHWLHKRRTFSSREQQHLSPAIITESEG